MLLCRYWPKKVEFASVVSGASWHPHLHILLVRLIGSWFDVWCSPLDMLFLGLLGRNSGAGQCQKLSVIDPEQLVWSYQTTHSLWVPLLDLCVRGEDQAVHQDWQTPVPSPGGRLAKGPKHPKICFCLPLPVGFLLYSVTESAAVSIWVTWGTFSMIHQ